MSYNYPDRGRGDHDMTGERAEKYVSQGASNVELLLANSSGCSCDSCKALQQTTPAPLPQATSALPVPDHNKVSHEAGTLYLDCTCDACRKERQTSLLEPNLDETPQPWPTSNKSSCDCDSCKTLEQPGLLSAPTLALPSTIPEPNDNEGLQEASALHSSCTCDACAKLRQSSNPELERIAVAQKIRPPLTDRGEPSRLASASGCKCDSCKTLQLSSPVWAPAPVPAAKKPSRNKQQDVPPPPPPPRSVPDTSSLLAEVLAPPPPVLTPSSSVIQGVPVGLPFLGLETGFDAPTFSKVNAETVSVQSQSIEAELQGLREPQLLTGDATSGDIQKAQALNKRVSALEAQIRDTNGLTSESMHQVLKVLDDLDELLKRIKLPKKRNAVSYKPVLDMSLSMLAVLARSLFSLPESESSEESFALSKRSLKIASFYLPEDHPARPIIASHWGTFYLQRFQVSGDLRLITAAIHFHQQSVTAVPDDHPKRAMFLGWLGRSYLARFEYSQVAEDLKNGITFNSQAWKDIESKAEKATTEERKHILEGKGRALQCLVEHVGGLNSISLINMGIREWREMLLDIFKDDNTAGDIKASCMRTLGFLYVTRFDQLGGQQPSDLERSLTFLSSAVTLLPKHHSDLRSTLCILAHSLVASTGDGASSQLAFEFLGLAKRLTRPGSPFEPHLLASFGDLYMSLSRQKADSAHLEDAIEYYRQALDHPACHPGSRLWAKGRQRLGLCRLNKYNSLKAEMSPLSIKQLELALREFIHIALSPRGHLFDRFTAACSWATNAASHPAFRTQALYGYETALELIPLLACFGAVPDQRRRATQRSGQLATEAAATAIEEGYYPLALTMLEQGRSVKWNYMLQLQRPLHTLKLHPDGEPLANRLEELLKRLQLEESTSSTESPMQASHDDLDLQSRYQQVLVDIRKIQGFANFMRPKPVEDLVKAARNGPVVVINVHKSRCDALVVHPFGRNPSIQHIPLPGLSLKHVIEMREAIDQSLEKIGSARTVNSAAGRKEEQHDQATEQLKTELKNLWYWVVHPILDGLGYKARSVQDSDPNELPHITWCATGPLSFLPLHAAGDYDDPRKKTFEYVVSSYTPTLSTLLPDSHHDVLPKSYCDILLVNPETSSEKDSLPAAKVELERIVRHYKMATTSLKQRFAENFDYYAARLGWSWGESKGSKSSQAQDNPQLSLDLEGVSDDESDQARNNKLPKSPQNPQDRDQGEVAHCTTLEGINASPHKVYEAMQKHDWVHFACHAVQNNGDPSKCGLYLSGGLLSLQKIAQMRYAKRGLAFLSACRTAKGDHSLPDEAVHLASGMLMVGYSSVIATLWPVKDNDAPDVTNAVYQRLLVDEGMKCHKSAVALHAALDKLRKHEGVRLPDWISFVHFGA
ncbi:CHAT domain protein [Rhizoctonia solani AG-3 Rhs1AP]|uniref:CHAT domain protein n=1 Tax=Rhizoctonia solani AG-3 Rhs1AP TaxID=1086054 RepID=X8J9J2_9AGAM|nr:CHAT domain protein [Rhizoctonia solani AG-3 Rhs1AP]